MFGKKKDQKRHDINLLELIPEQIVGSETGEDGKVTVLAPRFKSDLMKRLIGRRLKSPYIMMHLDEIGSTVWQNIDGERTIGEIAGILREKFGDAIEPCHDRLSIFFTQLELSSYIRYTNLEEVKSRSS